jgi:hypothetical protein
LNCLENNDGATDHNGDVPGETDESADRVEFVTRLLDAKAEGRILDDEVETLDDEDDLEGGEDKLD